MNWKVAGYFLDDVIGVFHGHNPSGQLVVDLTALTEMSTRNISWGVKVAGA
jgi:hypothetical protein